MSWYLNGTDMEAQGFYMTQIPGWWGRAPQLVESYPVTGQNLAIRGSTFRTPPRRWRMQVTLIEPTYTNRASKLDALELLLATSPSGVDSVRLSQPGEVELRLGDSTRVRYALPIANSGALIGGRLWNKGDTVLDLEFEFLDPALYETASSLGSIGSTPKQVALGTYESPWTMSIDGAATAPEMTVYEDSSGSAGTERWSLTCAEDVGSGETLVLNQIRQLAILDGTIDMTFLPPGAGYFYPLERTAGATSCWVAVSSGTGTLSYRPRWR